MYGLVARAVRVSPDGLVYRFALRPEARFLDGTRLTARDAAFSLHLLEGKGNPIISQRLREMAGAEAVDDQTLVVRFVEKRARDVPLFVASLPIFSRAYYTAHNFDETSLETPLGSGPYKVGRFEAGRYIEYQRVADWWGAALPVSVGHEQFRRVALRILPGPRSRLRRLHCEELSVPGGVHLAHLGDPLRFPRHARRTGQARRAARRHALGCAGLVRQSAAAQIRQSATPPRLELRLRFRMDQQDHHVRLLFADPVGVPEFRHDGEGTAEPGGARAAGAVAGQGAGPGVRRAVLAAGLRWLRPGPCVVAQGHANSRRRRLSHQGWQAGQRQGRADHLRVPDRRTDLRAPPHAVHQEPQNARNRGDAADRRSRAVSRPGRRLRFRRHRGPVRLFDHTRGFAAHLFLLPGGGDQGLAEPRRHRRSRHRRPDREDHRRPDPPGTGDGGARARPCDPLRQLLGSPLVQGFASGRLLGRVRPSPNQPRYSRGIPETWWYDRDKAPSSRNRDRQVAP